MKVEKNNIVYILLSVECIFTLLIRYGGRPNNLCNFLLVFFIVFMIRLFHYCDL